jgi:nucleoside-diphosphate-sugar epimerase
MNILITGEKSYVGTSLKRWLNQWADIYSVDSISLRNDNWKEKDFSVYDVLIHLVATVHKKENPEIKNEYYRINTDLTKEVALKAKHSGIKQFVFMSSISVYGVVGEVGKDIFITKDTPCTPNSLYGKSKLEAENELKKLDDKDYRVAIIRAPMIYGPGCPGNYIRLKKYIMKFPVFPLINNQRSMLFIDNLSEFIRLLIENGDSGVFFPQNNSYVNIGKLVKLIADENKKKIYFSIALSIGVKLFKKRFPVVNKIFGNLVFDSELSLYKDLDYCTVDLKESIKITENKLI